MACFISTLIYLYMLVIFIRIIMSWFPPTPGTAYAQIFEVFDRVTEPVLAPVRALLPPVRMGGMGLDLSPIVVFLVGSLLARAIC
jgi:YggT family protein